MAYSPDERETVIVCNDATKLCQIYSLQPSMINRMKKAGFIAYKVDSDGAHHFREIPQNRISFRKESGGKRKPMSEEHKRKLLMGRTKKT